MATPPIRAILFDLGGTLRQTTKRDDPERRERVNRIRQQLGAETPLPEFAETLAERYRAYRKWAERTMTELSEEQLWTRWLAPDFPPERVRALAPALNRMWRDATGVRELYPETKEVVQELRRRGYLLGIVSNTISQTEIPRALEASGLAGCFQAVVLSAVFGRRKPDPAILLSAAETLGVAPSRCALIGNRLDRDVLGARRAGFALVVIVHHGHHPDRQPPDPALAPDRIVHSLREIPALFPPHAPAD